MINNNYNIKIQLNERKILLIISHPDDECMFFGPTLLFLQDQNTQIHLLCLSIGNESGLDHPSLQDGPKNNWNPILISDIINDYVTKHKIDIIITFDEKGVSSHPNHIAAFNGAKHFIQSVTTSNNVILYKLTTVPILRKYISILDLPLTYQFKNQNHLNHLIFISSFNNFILARRAMTSHQSQLVWFRHLYILFSRYMMINELQLVK
ncbi:N-acetylglucosaminyl-phosphatidylinositol de-N-acetylase [Rhizophagus clarus]|uniref:N-acetylglucosaminylphosphatidylinositol deacetylase n=1 Tax=Rhizophagus clarus TaxID=94130 RepID=A0A8H3MJC5_9GLOM|nr:N-acetylglucosaminyl-phosphatidylinositol de-N-acetylase [Rhizophagus clarus]